MPGAITLVFPNQLFADHPALAAGRPVYLIEDTLFFGDPHASPGRFHQQKIVLHRASMKAWKRRAEAIGFEITYLDYEREMTVGKILTTLYQAAPFDEIVTANPADFLLEKRLRRFCSENGVHLTITDSPLFLTPQDWADRHFDSRKKPFMAAFYEAQRKRMGILLDASGGPLGGSWSYDEDNRKPMPKKGLAVPPDPSAPRRPEVEEALAYVAGRFADYPGEAAGFGYAVTHDDASDWLDVFFAERFAQFGPYEDALATSERVLFHSLLTPALNIGLLTPQEVVDRALAYAAAHDVPLASLEGFIRQIIGWREFIYQMYRRHGVEMRNGNFFGHTRDLPDSFWTATTGVAPLDLVIGRVLKTGYAHHIERLMVLGNFMMLCQYEPRQVNDWFMELFIDAYDWVMVPNVYGMSQFADGGIFTTKPYFSGSNYLKKMSDYRTGPWGEIWDGLFWNFIDRHHDFFKSQYRLSMMAKTWEKMDGAKREAHLRNASDFLDGAAS
jgi:deoxyribodipyrimidine photolyase-related protein